MKNQTHKLLLMLWSIVCITPSIIKPVSILAINNTPYNITMQTKPFGALFQQIATHEVTIPAKRDKTTKVFITEKNFIPTSGGIAQIHAIGLIEEINLTAIERVNWFSVKKLKKTSISLPGKDFYPIDITNLPQLVLLIHPEKAPNYFSIKLYQITMGTDIKERILGSGEFALKLPLTMIEGIFKHKPESVKNFEKLFDRVSKQIPLKRDDKISTTEKTAYQVDMEKYKEIQNKR